MSLLKPLGKEKLGTNWYFFYLKISVIETNILIFFFLRYMTPSWISPLWAHAVKYYWILCDLLQLCVLQLTFTICYVPGRSTCCCISSTDPWLMNRNHPHFTDVGNAAREVKYHAHAHTVRSGQNSCAGLCVWLKKKMLFLLLDTVLKYF